MKSVADPMMTRTRHDVFCRAELIGHDPIRCGRGGRGRVRAGGRLVYGGGRGGRGSGRVRRHKGGSYRVDGSGGGTSEKRNAGQGKFHRMMCTLVLAAPTSIHTS
jgi:hypothetical protein